MTARRDGVVGLAWSVLADLDLELVLQRALDAARNLTGARYAALGILNDDRTELERFLTTGLDSEIARGIGSLPRGRGVLGELIRWPQPLRLEDVETHPHSYGFPPGHPPMHTFLGVPILVGGQPYGNLYLTEKEDGEPFDEGDEEAVVEIAEFAGLAIDHTRRYEDLAAREGAVRRTANALEATVSIARTLAGQTDMGVVLDLVAKRGRALVSARTFFVELADGDRITVAAVAGEAHPELRGTSVTRQRSIAAKALTSRRPERLGGPVDAALRADYGDGVFLHDVGDALVAPLVVRDKVHGALVALDRHSEGPCFSEQDQELLEAFAASAAIAVATARSFDDNRRRARLVAAEAERSRWARGLHDDTLKGLLDLGRTVEAIADADPEDARRLSELAAGEIRVEAARLRSLITELRPLDLDRKGIEWGMKDLIAELAESGVAIDATVDLAYEAGRDPRRHTTDLETAVYRIVQEGVRNAVTHAPGARIAVEVTDDDQQEEIVVRVTDDGPGFDPAAVDHGFGLQAVRERVDLLNGSMTVSSAVGEGSEIYVRLPGDRRGETSEVVGPRLSDVEG